MMMTKKILKAGMLFKLERDGGKESWTTSWTTRFELLYKSFCSSHSIYKLIRDPICTQTIHRHWRITTSYTTEVIVDNRGDFCNFLYPSFYPSVPHCVVQSSELEEMIFTWCKVFAGLLSLIFFTVAGIPCMYTALNLPESPIHARRA